MSKKSKTKEKPTEEEKRNLFSKFSDTWTGIATAIGFLVSGFLFGCWVTSKDNNISALQNQLDCKQKIEEAKIEWEREAKEESTRNELLILLKNLNQSNDKKDESK